MMFNLAPPSDMRVMPNLVTIHHEGGKLWQFFEVCLSLINIALWDSLMKIGKDLRR